MSANWFSVSKKTHKDIEYEEENQYLFKVRD